MKSILTLDYLDNGAPENARKSFYAHLAVMGFVRDTNVSTTWVLNYDRRPLEAIRDAVVQAAGNGRLGGIVLSRGDEYLSEKNPVVKHDTLAEAKLALLIAGIPMPKGMLASILARKVTC